MNQQTMPNLSLFDLLARQWQRPAPIGRLCFNADTTLLAISAADGSVALARLADNEPPQARITVEGGQTVIRPRQGKPAPLINTRVQESVDLAADRESGFLALTGSGTLLRLDRGGEITGKLLADKSPISAFARCRATDAVAVVVRDHLRLTAGEAGPVIDVGLDVMRADILSFSVDGTLLASAGAGGLTLRASAAPGEPLRDLALPVRPLALAWSPDGRWLACGLERGGLCLFDTATGDIVMQTDFPGPVGQIDWSGGTLLAAGAYRIAGWTIEPSNTPVALTTGRAGFVMTAAVAAHPTRRIVAAGHVNGRVVLAPIGKPEELVVREGGGPVTALQWSPDGRHLAIGDALGSAAIVTFPDDVFKQQ